MSISHKFVPLFLAFTVFSPAGAENVLAFNIFEKTSSTISPNQISLEFPPSSDRGAPRTGGGGTRSGNSCINENMTGLKALMPTSSNVARTARDNPDLYWYVPETMATNGEFVLIDEEGNEVYFTSFELPTEAGLVKLSVPDDTGLKVGKSYTWYFTVICNMEDRSYDRYVDGSLERTKLSDSLESQISRLNPLEQAGVYAEYRIWHETLSIIEGIRSEEDTKWKEFLTSVKLEEFAEEKVQLVIAEE